MEDKKIKYSGENETFDTGATREKKTGKGLYSCLPPEAIRQLALIYEGGAEIHGTFNYRKGLPLSSFLNSALRHLFQTLAGSTDENHPAHCVWNILEYMEALSRIKKGTLPAELDDRWKEPDSKTLTPVKEDYIGVPSYLGTDMPPKKPGIGTAADYIDTNTKPIPKESEKWYTHECKVCASGCNIKSTSQHYTVRFGNCNDAVWNLVTPPTKPSSKIITHTGKGFDVFNPAPADIDIVDIAMALGNQCRYAGHTKRFYSVAEHCVRMSWIAASEETKRACLMHDASEAYLVDMPSPIKQHLTQYKEIEENVMQVIYAKFGIFTGGDVAARVKYTDQRMLKTEIIYLLPESNLFDNWYPARDPYVKNSTIANGIKNDPWSPEEAQDWFLKRAQELGLYTPEKEKV